jgi:hypothetical protein
VLPAEKSIHLRRYAALVRERRLVHQVGVGRGDNGQRERWDQALRPGSPTGIYQETWDDFESLNVREIRRLRPNWTRTQMWANDAIDAMEVDHIVDDQVCRHLPNNAWYLDMSNLELLDRVSNGAAGIQLSLNIAAERQRLAAATGNPAWATANLVFTTVIPTIGNPGMRWLPDEIRDGDHYHAYLRHLRRGARRQGRGPPPERVPQSVHSCCARSGRGLPAPLRGRAEAFFGVGLSHVRIHDDAFAARAAAESRAHAVAVGQHILLSGERRQLESPMAERTLVHEIAHTLQPPVLGESAGGSRFEPENSHLEFAAHRAAEKFVAQRGGLTWGQASHLDRNHLRWQKVPSSQHARTGCGQSRRPFRHPLPRPAARRTATQILGDPSVAPALPGMTLNEFRVYTREQADWFVEPTVAGTPLREDLWQVLLFAEEGPHMLSGVGDLPVADLSGVAPGDFNPLRTFCLGTHSSGHTVRIFPPYPALAGRIQLGRTLSSLEQIIPPAVLEATASDTQLLQLQTQGLLPLLRTYWTDFEPHLEQNFVAAPGARGPEFDRVLNFLNSLGANGLAPLSPLRGATATERWVRNLHRFPLPMLLKLVSNLGVTAGTKRLILVLHTGHDAPAAFQESASLFSNLVLNAPNDLVLMIEGPTSLAAVTTRIPNIASTWGQRVSGVRRISQVIIAGHGSAQSAGLAGTGPPAVGPGGAVSYPEESLDISTPGARANTQALLDALLSHMHPATARLLYAGCLVGSTDVAAGTPTTAIFAALAANQSLGAFTEARAVAAGIPPGRVQAARASVALASVTSLFTPAGNIAVTYPFDPHAFGPASTYASSGVEPAGVLRAAVEVGATNPVTAETLLRTRLALPATAGWYDTITRMMVSLALPPAAVPPTGVNLQLVNDLANVAEIPFLTYWPQYNIQVAHYTGSINPQPFAPQIYAGLAGTNAYTAPVADSTQRCRILVDQGWLALVGAPQIPTLLAGILATNLPASAFSDFLDLAVLAPHAAALLPLAGVPTTEQIRLGLAWFFQDPNNAHIRAFLTNQVTQAPNAPASFTAALSAEVSQAGRTDREILDQLGFAAVAVAAPAAPGLAPRPLANLALRGSATNTLLVTGRPYLATVTAATIIPRRNPADAQSGFVSLNAGAQVRVMGMSSGWAAADFWGQLGFIRPGDLTPPPP